MTTESIIEAIGRFNENGRLSYAVELVNASEFLDAYNFLDTWTPVRFRPPMQAILPGQAIPALDTTFLQSKEYQLWEEIMAELKSRAKI